MKRGWYILLYHNISWEENAYVRGIGGTCPPDRFRDHITHLRKIGELVSIPDGLRLLRKGEITRPLFSFWFDDGLSDIRKYALPLLQQQNISAAISVCNRFVEHTEFFWRFKLSYLSYIDGLRFLRARLRKYGYKHGESIKVFCKTHFSQEIVREIDDIFRRFTSEIQQKDAFRIFETRSGLLELKKAGWIIANHTAAHYPISEDVFADQFYTQFTECEEFLRALFGEASEFWVLPFENVEPRVKILLETPHRDLDGRYIVFVGEAVNYASNIEADRLFRISAPICNGKELVTFLENTY